MCTIIKNCVVLLFLGFGTQVHAQNWRITGTLINGDSSNILSKASITLIPASDTLKKQIFSADEKGIFSIPVSNGIYLLQFSYTGYDLSDRTVTINNSNMALGEVLLFRKQKTLGDVVVVGKVPPARQKGDTTEFNAAAFKVNPDGTVEDLLRKAPGIVIQNGQVTAQGEQVQRVTIDGREFFGNDATAALKNLPAEVVDKIQVYDRMSDQAQLTGVSDGNETKAINIVTKANMRNGQFGRIYGGYGTNERYAAGTSMNLFQGNRRINIIGLFNNVNQQNFSGEDLLGVNGQASQGRGRGRGGWGGGGGSFFTDQQAGIATTNAMGINFSDLWAKKKMEVTGSYFFNNARTTAFSATNRETFLGDTSQFYKETNESVSNNFNHRINGRFQYKIDSNNTLIIAPNISFQNNDGQNLLKGGSQTANGSIINNTINNRITNSKGYNIRNEITYRRGFAKRGRSFSINLNTNFNDRSNLANLDAVTTSRKAGLLERDTLKQLTDNQSNGYGLSTNITYSEPVGKKSIIQINYNPQVNVSKADQQNRFLDKGTNDFTIFDTLQSNLFDNKTTIQNAGVNYRLGERGDFSIGLNFQNTNLNSNQIFPMTGNIKRSFSNWLPNLSYRKDFSKQTNLRVRYRASVNTPSINQLQNVVNINNPIFLSSGNAELGQSYTQFMFARISYTDAQKGKSLFAGIFAQQVNDYITNATWVASNDSLVSNGILLRKGAQFSKPVNLNGYWSVRSFFNYGLPLKVIKSNLNFNGGVSYVRTPGAVNGISNFTNNFTYTGGVTVASNINEFIDFTLSYSGNFNNAINSFNPNLNNKFYSHNVSGKVNLLTKSGWFVLNDVSNQLFSGLADGFNQNFWLWNVSAGKKFLAQQRGELKMSVFDMLKQNQSVNRTVDALYIEDVQTQVLQQYFMLTFTYTLRNFGKGIPKSPSR